MCIYVRTETLCCCYCLLLFLFSIVSICCCYVRTYVRSAFLLWQGHISRRSLPCSRQDARTHCPSLQSLKCFVDSGLVPEMQTRKHSGLSWHGTVGTAQCAQHSGHGTVGTAQWARHKAHSTVGTAQLARHNAHTRHSGWAQHSWHGTVGTAQLPTAQWTRPSWHTAQIWHNTVGIVGIAQWVELARHS